MKKFFVLLILISFAIVFTGSNSSAKVYLENPLFSKHKERPTIKGLGLKKVEEGIIAVNLEFFNIKGEIKQAVVYLSLFVEYKNGKKELIHANIPLTRNSVYSVVYSNKEKTSGQLMLFIFSVNRIKKAGIKKLGFTINIEDESWRRSNIVSGWIEFKKNKNLTRGAQWKMILNH